MSTAVATTAQIVGEEYARAMAEANPLAVVEGKPISSRPNPTVPQKKKKWSLFGRK
jgi:hypothetical protein